MLASMNRYLVVHSHLNWLDKHLYLKGFILLVMVRDTGGDTRCSLLGRFSRFLAYVARAGASFLSANAPEAEPPR